MAGPGVIVVFGVLLMAFIFKNVIQFNQNFKGKVKEFGPDLFKYGEQGEVFVYIMLLTAHFI